MGPRNPHVLILSFIIRTNVTSWPVSLLIVEEFRISHGGLVPFENKSGQWKERKHPGPQSLWSCVCGREGSHTPNGKTTLGFQSSSLRTSLSYLLFPISHSCSSASFLSWSDTCPLASLEGRGTYRIRRFTLFAPLWMDLPTFPHLISYFWSFWFCSLTKSFSYYLKAVWKRILIYIRILFFFF